MTRERAPKPGVTWETEPRPVEVIVDWAAEDDPGPVSGDCRPPAPEPRPNRATRRAAARAARRRNT